MTLPPPAMVQYLPTETLLRILSFAAIPSPLNSSDVSSTRYTTLRSAALVCRGWRTPAQALLWEQVDIVSSLAACQFVAAAKTAQFRTTQLRIQPRTTGLRDVVEGCLEVIRVCRGIQRLELYSLREAEVGLLTGPGVAGPSRLYPRRPHELTIFPDLESLVIHNSFFRLGVHPHSSFHFSLLDLSLSLGPSAARRWTTDSLTPFLQPSLTSLSLQIHPFSNDQVHANATFIPPLTAVAPQLTTLRLEATSSFILAATPFLTALTALLHLTAIDPFIFPHLLIPLKSWTSPLQALLPEITDVLLAPSVATSKLERLVFSEIPEDRARMFGFWSVVVPECERRGIECVFEGSKVEGQKGWKAVRIPVRCRVLVSFVRLLMHALASCNRESGCLRRVGSRNRCSFSTPVS